MAEGKTFMVEDGDVGEFSVPSSLQLGLGRGFSRPSEPRTPGPRDTVLGTPLHASTRNVDRTMPSPVEQNPGLSSLITQLADKIGESITARLQSEHSAHSSRAPVQSSETTQSSINVVMHSDAREPPIFRGDGSDKFTVHEWENLMSLYLRKRAIPVEEHSHEILARLMGKAGDVVRIKLRNNASLNHTAEPYVIYDILKRHFSEMTYSSMPLADFYNTVPMQGEDAMEYWIRLNKTIDVADECLRRQGRSIDDPSREVSMMFIKHCPDQSLAGVFKFKSAEKWSACDIQERLDEHMQETRNRACKSFRPGTAAQKVHSQCQVPMVDNVIAPVVNTAPVSSTAPVLNTGVSPVPSPAAPATGGFDNDCMRSLVSLLGQLVTQQTQVPAGFNTQPAGSHSSQKVCRVCGSPGHSTVAHCRRENRCLKCLCPGHWKKDCPQQTNQRRFQTTDGTGGQNQQLN